MKTIRIYWVECHSGVMGSESGRGWHYEAWKGDHLNTTGETLDSIEVKIPEGMTFGKNNLEMVGLFDRSGYCELGGNLSKPVVYTASGAIVLEIVKNQ